MRLFALVIICCLSWPAVAVVDVVEFRDEVSRQRYLSFIDELRCPKCQNQNLAGSDSPIAADLRRELRRLLEEGKSDKEIVDFMVSRYGEYVLYRPKVTSSTAVLWGLPLLLLSVGFLVIAYTVKQRRKTGADAQLKKVSEQDQRRLKALLEEAKKRDSE